MSNEYYVYVAKDAEGVVVYVGSGKGKRIDHVNSGCSHSPDINRHVILHGELEVTKVEEYLTRGESLEKEQEWQDEHSPVYNKNRAVVTKKKKLTRSDYKIAVDVLRKEYSDLNYVLSCMEYPACCYCNENLDSQKVGMALDYLESLLESG